MKDINLFPTLLLIARPAAGKSEIIDYLKKTPGEERARRFHVGRIEEVDDFPMLWTWFEEDALLEKMGHPRLYTDAAGYFLYDHLWDLLIERIGVDFQKKLRDLADNARGTTILVEFSRGSQQGGYARAFSHLSSQMIENMAVLYIDVSWEESFQKNKKRFNPDKADSILQHSLSDEKMERLYRETDWPELCKADPDYLILHGVRVPYGVFDNADDVTTNRGAALGDRLEQVLTRLWDLYKKPGP